MIGQLVLHPHTKAHVAQFITQPSHATLLVGGNGIGKAHLAEILLAEMLDLSTEQLHVHPYFLRITADKDSISIDAIRELQRFLQLRTLGDKPLRRAVIVEHAEGLTTEAQNAFLKVLEEPPSDTIIMLTTDSQRSLLPTIISRLQTITLHPPDEAATKAYFIAQGKAEKDIARAYFLSGGLPGLMTALLDEDQNHPLVIGVETAKKLLQATTFERLAMVETLSKQKEEIKYTLEALRRIAQTGLSQAAVKNDAAKIKQWHNIRKLATEASDALAQNANAKLVLSNLMAQL